MSRYSPTSKPWLIVDHWTSDELIGRLCGVRNTDNAEATVLAVLDSIFNWIAQSGYFTGHGIPVNLGEVFTLRVTLRSLQRFVVFATPSPEEASSAGLAASRLARLAASLTKLRRR